MIVVVVTTKTPKVDWKTFELIINYKNAPVYHIQSEGLPSFSFGEEGIRREFFVPLFSRPK